MDRKNTSRAQRAFNELSNLIARLPGLFYWKDMEGQYLGCSPGLLTVLNLQLKNLIGKTDYQLWPKQAGVLKAYDEQVITRRKPITCEETITLESGEQKVLLVTRAPWEDEHSNIIGIVGNLFDITAQKKKEVDLKNDLKKMEFELRKVKENVFNAEKTSRTKTIPTPIVSKTSQRKVPKVYDSAPINQKNNGGPRRILMVEDHPITAKITQTILSDFNCTVEIAVNGESAIQQVKNSQYDLILMDIGLPDIDGCEVTRQIRLYESTKGSNHTPIIGLTARVDSENQQWCIDVGMNAVFSKPLMKEKVQDIFMSFVPKYTTFKESNVSVFKKREEKVIDLALGARLIGGDKKLAKEAIMMMVNSFPEELAKLDKAYQKSDWQEVQMIVHKLRGGTSYCGTPRLKEACIRLDDYLQSSDDKTMQREMDAYYQQLLKEVEAIQQSLPEFGLTDFS